jgi:hypothetical protein
VGLADAHVELGREQDARAEAAEVLRLAPNFSFAEFRRRVRADWDLPRSGQLLDHLRKAGLE